MDGNRILASAPFDDAIDEDIGQVHLFTVAVDLNHDGLINCLDVNGLVMVIVSGTNELLYDLTGDGQVDADDLDEWLIQAGSVNLLSGNPYLLGDANLDGVVDGMDFLVWNRNKFNSTPAWCSGDFNADGVVDGIDFLEWNQRKFTSSDGATAVPEPDMSLVQIVWIVSFAASCWTQKRNVKKPPHQ